MNGSLIQNHLEKVRASGTKGLITFITAGYPDLEATKHLAQSLAAAGADIIELGIPFSDPLADGPVIQEASYRALRVGVTVAGVLDCAAAIKGQCSRPVVLMGYYNPVLKYGIRQFVRDAVSAGVSGLILADLPHDESGTIREECDAGGLDLIPLVAPTTTETRLAAITAQARGFIYLISVTGVTGTRHSIDTDLSGLTRKVRRHTSLPLAVGFGISSPESAARVAGHCDAVVVGSALVKTISGCSSVSEAVLAVGRLTASFRNNLDNI